MAHNDLHEHLNVRGAARRADARAAGLSDSAFVRHAAKVGAQHVRRDLWVPAGVEMTHDQRVDAVFETLQDRALLTGASALYRDGVLDAPPTRVEVLLPTGRRIRPWPGVCFHRTTTFDEVRSRQLGGHPVAATPRCFADHAAHVALDELCRDLTTALRKRRCTLGTAASELAMRQRYPGRARHAQAIARLSEETNHSTDERLARRLLRAEGLRPHREPLTIDTEDRGPIAEIDIAFPALLLGIEIDGPHHLLQHVAAADRQRDRLLASIGWRIERFFWFEVEERRAWFVAQVQRFVAERAAATAR